MKHLNFGRHMRIDHDHEDEMYHQRNNGSYFLKILLQIIKTNLNFTNINATQNFIKSVRTEECGDLGTVFLWDILPIPDRLTILKQFNFTFNPQTDDTYLLKFESLPLDIQSALRHSVTNNGVISGETCLSIVLLKVKVFEVVSPFIDIAIEDLENTYPGQYKHEKKTSKLHGLKNGNNSTTSNSGTNASVVKLDNEEKSTSQTVEEDFMSQLRKALDVKVSGA